MTMSAYLNAAVVFVAMALTAGCSVKDNWVDDLRVDTSDDATVTDANWEEPDTAYATEDQVSGDMTAEDMTAEDMTAEDMTADEVAAEDGGTDAAAEDAIALDSVATDDTATSEDAVDPDAADSVDPVLDIGDTDIVVTDVSVTDASAGDDASTADVETPDVPPVDDVVDLDVQPALDVDLSDVAADDTTVDPGDVTPADDLADPADTTIAPDAVDPLAPVLQFGFVTYGPNGVVFTEWHDGDTHEIVTGVQGLLHTEVAVRVLTTYTGSLLLAQISCGTTQAGTLVGSYVQGYNLASPEPGVYQSQVLTVIFQGYDPTLYQDTLATLTCQLDWTDPVTFAPVSLSATTSGLLVDAVP